MLAARNVSNQKPDLNENNYSLRAVEIRVKTTKN
jgi:hypothetical protein